METKFEELPVEIWELILNHISDDHYSEFESLSLVSKRMLSVTDRLQLRFTVVHQAYFIHGTIYPYIDRYKNLKTLDLSKLGNCNLETTLMEIARSPVALNLEVVDISKQNSVPIESLKSLRSYNRKIRVLKCADVLGLRNDDLKAIAKFLPDLEELDISYSVNKLETAVFNCYSSKDIHRHDAGIEYLSSGLKNLIKIDISMNGFLTDKSLVHLSSNCLRLQEISFESCKLITMKGVMFMLHNSPNLRSISMNKFKICEADSLFINPATSTRCLSTLHISDSDISDQFLDSIVKARFPLQSVCFSNCRGYSLRWLSSFLHAYHKLKFLDLSCTKFLSDKSIIKLSHYLQDLVSVKLTSCYKLTNTSLFALINKCKFLEHVEMIQTNMGLKGDSSTDIVNYIHTKSSIKSLNLHSNSHLSDKCLLKICSMCPKLNSLDVSWCRGITRSVGEILRSCREVEHLSIEYCDKVTNIGLDLENECLRLKKLYMARSGVNDVGLFGIAISCNELVKIDLERCQFVTTNAVKFMVKNCKKLREVNLMGCPNLHVFIVDWIVHTRPSLRKLVPPSYAVTTENQRQLMLRHGCNVCVK